MTENNIIKIVSSGRCCGCGVCVGICPYGALSMKMSRDGFYRPSLETHNKCRNCSLCLKICPVYNKENLLNKENISKAFGGYVNIYGGWVKNKQLRSEASSGGVARGLAFYLLNKKIINGVWTITQNNDNLLEPRVVLFKTAKDLMRMSKSLYLPTEYSKVTKYLSENSGCYLVIGLPCQIAGLRRAEKYFKAKVILVDLFCGRVVSKLLTEGYIKLFTREKIENLSLDYRDKISGWYNFSISIKNKTNEKMIATREFNKSIFGFLMNRKYFAQNSCFDCSYSYSGVSDITLGDFWKKEYSNKKRGVSLIVARTEYGDEILKRCKSILLFQVKASDLYSAQSHLVKNYKFSTNKLLVILNKKKQVFNKIITKLYLLSRNLKFIYYLGRLDDGIFVFIVKIFNLTKTLLKYSKILIWGVIFGLLQKIAPTGERDAYFQQTSNKGKKIFITGVPDICNQGSFAMFKTLIDNIDKCLGEHAYILETENVKSAQKTLVDLDIKNVEVIPDYFSISSKTKPVFLFKYFFRLLQINLELKRWKKSSITVKKLLESKVIINIGGDTLSHSSGQFTTIMGLDKLLLGKQLGLKTVILAHTLGIYREPHKDYILSKMKEIDLITARESPSFDYMVSLGFKGVIKVSDLAFLLKPTDYVAKKIKIGKMGEFVCFVPSTMLYKKTFSDLENLNKKYQAYMEINRYIIDNLLKRGLRVLLIPHVYVKSYRDDLNAREIKKNLYPHERGVVYLDTQFYAHEIKEIIKYSKCVISFRMHPTISAISQGVPCFLITDTHKGRGVLEGLIPENFIINCWGASQNELKTRIKTQLPNFLNSLAEIKQKITQSKIKELQAAASKNLILLNKLIQEKGNPSQ